MKTFCFFLGVFLVVQINGQKLIKKALVDDQTEFIQVDSKYCYQVNLHTSKTQEVVVEASMEGEYSKDLLVSIEKDGANLTISTGFQPNFTNPNDKLSAHKVVSIALDVSLPEYKDVFLFGTSSHVSAQGKYQNLRVTLSDGRCVLNNVLEVVDVTTQKGDIVLTVPNGDIMAKSTYGEVLKETIPFGDNRFRLNSVEGNIHLRKTK